MPVGSPGGTEMKRQLFVSRAGRRRDGGPDHMIRYGLINRRPGHMG